MSAQAEDGRFPKAGADWDTVQFTSWFAWVIADAMRTTGNAETYRVPLERAAAHLVSAQNPGSGWRHGVRPGDNDSHHTALALMGLAKAISAGIQVPDETIQSGLSYLDAVTDEVTGKAGYMSKGDWASCARTRGSSSGSTPPPRSP